MNRFAYNQLLNWKKCSNSNFLILGGVLGVGKTTLIKEFAKREFNNTLYLDLDKKNSLQLQNIVDELDDFSLIVLDNIFGDRKLLDEVFELSKKRERHNFIFIDPYIKEGRGEHNIVSARYLILKPLSFEEFLFNVDRDLFNKLSVLGGIKDISEDLNDSLLKLFSDYIYVGGMPSVVDKYINSGITEDIRLEQQLILDKNYNRIKSYYKTTSYKNLKAIIDTLFNSLIRDNQKFKLTDISSSRRFTSFKSYFDILENLNLIYKSYCVKENNLEINEKSFILYFFDTGLLGLIGDVPYELYKTNKLFNTHIMLGLCQNFVANEISTFKNLNLYQWTHNMSKIEFLIKSQDKLIPIELKNDISGKLKSFDVFNTYLESEENIRINLSVPALKGRVLTYPLYIINTLLRKRLV